MAKLIIWCPGRTIVYGFKRREFLWNEEYKCYVFRGRQFDELEFNSVVDKALLDNQDMNPRVKVVSTATKAAKPLAPISTITSAREISSRTPSPQSNDLSLGCSKRRQGPDPEAIA